MIAPRPSFRNRPLLAALALGLLLIPAAARAGDLIEPWDPGFSDVELFVELASGARPAATTTLGFGAGHGLSLGLSFSAGDDPGALGLSATWSRSWERAGELDLFFQVDSPMREAELGEVARAWGIEWSGASTAERTPYLRLTAHSVDGELLFHPLVGLRFAAGPVDLHLELSAEQPAAGERWPLHVAIGPNLLLARDLELLTELSLLWDRGTGRLEPALSVGVVTTPSALRSTPRFRSPSGAP